jgi:hypothetical protein
MNTLSSEKFSFSFILAILFHLMLLTASVLTLNPNDNNPAKPPLEALQATLFDEQVLENQLQQAKFLAQIPVHKLTKAEKRRLAREKRAALRGTAKKKKSSPVLFPQLNKTLATPPSATAKTVSPSTAPTAAEKAAQLKKAQARERWLKKVAAQKKTGRSTQE